MLVDQENGQEVTCFSELRILLYFFTPLVDDFFAEVTEGLCVTSLIPFKRRNVVSSEEWEEADMELGKSID